MRTFVWEFVQSVSRKKFYVGGIEPPSTTMYWLLSRILGYGWYTTDNSSSRSISNINHKQILKSIFDHLSCEKLLVTN